jgi:hypothetical protein
VHRICLGLLALLLACVERPAPGWKVLGPKHWVRGPLGGNVALRDEAGELLLARTPSEALGEVPEFDSATAYRGGWLLTQHGTEGELGVGTRNWFRSPDGSVVQLERRFSGAAVTNDGIYLLQKYCNFHRSTTTVTQIEFARDLESEAVVVAGPWEWLCARSIAVDDDGRIWLVGSIHGITADLSNAVLILEEGQPRIVHRVFGSDDYVLQDRTQLAIVDDVLYLSAPSNFAERSTPDVRWPGILRLVPTADGLHEAAVVPSDLRIHRGRWDVDPLEERFRLASMGVKVDDDDFYILPYHQPLDAIVDRLVEVVSPIDTVTLNALDVDGCPDYEALGRLPAGVTVGLMLRSEDDCEDAFYRRFGHLRRPE